MLKKTFKVLSLILIVFITNQLSGQTFLNGSFEINTSSPCNYNMPNATFTSLMANSTGYGVQSQLDIMNNTCPYGTPQNGLWMVSLATNGGTTDAFTTMLSAPLVAGNTYIMSFYDRGDPNYPPGVPIQIGISTVAGAGGTIVYTGPVPLNGPWSFRSFSFVAPNNGQHVSISTTGAPLWTFVDNFCLGAGCVPLPIELTNFTNNCKGNSVELNWTTATEKDNDYFTVEKSKDAYNFFEIGRVKGAGNSNSLLKYEFTDANLQTEVSYYRIKQTDFDKSFTYSQILSSEKCKPVYDVQFDIFPNPSNDQLKINSNVFSAKIIIVNALGKIIYESNTEYYGTSLDVSQFENGLYFVQMINDGTIQTKKFIKN
ncbi:MAG TPA: T9SS type A sorting domain-containing protein [Bacteroidia bacterium]|jgi:hypothetical protein|nr:T9SS type A sorting domain-containing protein [Bacteroidia bacterium]